MLGKTNLKVDKKNVTKISDLSCFNPNQTFSFLDESKKTKNCNITMFSLYPKGFLEPSDKICCWWCSHFFKTKPIGIPLRYVPNQIIKTYTSEITKDKYVIKENVSKSFSTDKNENERIECEKIEKDYYETEGIFCSFNCFLAFIDENKHNSRYRNSKILMSNIYKEYFGKDLSEINPAPSWKLLEEYGGYMSIEEFRDKMNTFVFIDNGILLHKEIFKTCGTMVEEKQKF
jgi:hypothetical protein